MLYELHSIDWRDADDGLIDIKHCNDGAIFTVSEAVATATLPLFSCEQPFTRLQNGAVSLQNPVRFVGTAFRSHMADIAFSVAHNFDSSTFKTLLGDDRVAAVQLHSHGQMTAIPILAAEFADNLDLMILRIPLPSEEVGKLPCNFAPMHELDVGGFNIISGYQDTIQNEDSVSLWPALFRGFGAEVDSEQREYIVHNRRYSPQSEHFRIPMRARPGLSGSPMLAMGRSGTQQHSGQVVGVMASTRTYPDDPEMTDAYFVPLAPVVDIPLTHAGFGHLQGSTLRKSANDYVKEPCPTRAG